MSEHQDTQFEQFVLVILAVVAGIAAVIYAILWVWPYILFYVLPLAAASLLYGGIFWLCTRPSETDAGEVKAEFRYSEDKCYKPLYQYRSLLVAFSLPRARKPRRVSFGRARSAGRGGRHEGEY